MSTYLVKERIEVLLEQRDELQARANDEGLDWPARWDAWRRLARVEGWIAEERREMEREAEDVGDSGVGGGVH